MGKQEILSALWSSFIGSLHALRTSILFLAGRTVAMPLASQMVILLLFGAWFIILWLRLEREKHLARTDPLTGVANRRAFLEAAETGFPSLKQSPRALTIAYIDLDNFKGINDRAGHRAGDFILRLVAHCIRRNLRHTDCVARLGGDEFAVLLYDTDPTGARRALQHVWNSLSQTLKQTRWPITSSVGAVIFVDHPPSVRYALTRVDALMYAVKRAGKNNLSLAVWGRQFSRPYAGRVHSP